MDAETILVTCPRCGAKNRLPRARLKDRPVCGKCRAPLPVAGKPFDHPVEVADGTFQKEVIEAREPVVLDCWAPWCGPCRTVAPILDQLVREYAGRIKFAKLNVDENPGTAGRFSIQSIPTLLFFKSGQLVNRQVGALPKGGIERHLKGIL
jgi:thioredoxin 2